MVTAAGEATTRGATLIAAATRHAGQTRAGSGDTRLAEPGDLTTITSIEGVARTKDARNVTATHFKGALHLDFEIITVQVHRAECRRATQPMGMARTEQRTDEHSTVEQGEARRVSLEKTLPEALPQRYHNGNERMDLRAGAKNNGFSSERGSGRNPSTAATATAAATAVTSVPQE